jgi:3-deoxy-D-manno-octulosonic-acid transferase
VMEKLVRRFPTLQVILAPRHIERMTEIEALFASRSLPSARKSKEAAGRAPYLLWDSMGDLIDAYKQADVAVIGGSFVPSGGQNPIEPASLSVPVVFGPSMENFFGIAEVLVQQGGARQVPLSGLENCLAELLGQEATRREMGRRARAAVESRQGATDKTLSLLKVLAHA